jgi:xanthine/uracil permease
VITTAGRRTLGVKQTSDLLITATWVALAVVLIWFARAVWPIVPAVVVALLSLALVGQAITRAIRNSMTTRGHGVTDRLIVQPITRDEWRKQRWQRKQNFRVAALTGMITLVATAVATFLATVAAFDELPAWWPF